MAKKIYSEEEARERKNARQREYAKKTGYAANAAYNKRNVKRYVVNCTCTTESDIIEYLEGKSNKMGYIKDLIRADMEKNKK